MTDFAKIAADAKLKSDELIAFNQDKTNQDRAAAIRDREEAVDFLNANVMPVLYEAQAAFRATKVPSIIVASWLNNVPTTPSVLFQCVGPALNNSFGGTSTPIGIGVEVSRKEGETILRVGQNGASTRPSVVMRGELVETLPKAIEQSLITYHDDLARILKRS